MTKTQTIRTSLEQASDGRIYNSGILSQFRPSISDVCTEPN